MTSYLRSTWRSISSDMSSSNPLFAGTHNFGMSTRQQRAPRATTPRAIRKDREPRIPQWTPIRPTPQVPPSRSIPLWRSGSPDGDLLLEAVQANDIQALTEILDSGVSARQRGRGGETPLTRAVRTGSIPMVRPVGPSFALLAGGTSSAVYYIGLQANHGAECAGNDVVGVQR